MRVVAVAGARAGRYELLEELERDGVTSAWLSRAARPGSPPTRVQVLDPRVGVQLELRTEFLREARAAQAARHERLLPIEDLGPFGPGAYLATPWLDSVALDDLLAEAARRGTPLPAGVILRIALDVLDPLSALHTVPPTSSPDSGPAQPTFHGDFTPHAVWLTGQGRVYLSTSCVGPAISSLAADDIASRLAFKAPEQLQAGGARPDVRVDQFAFGAMLWSALAGHRLFVGADSVALVRAVLSTPVPNLADVGVVVPAGVANVVARALSRDPDARFRDMHELALALRAASADVLADLATVARAVSDLGIERLRTQRRKISELFGTEAHTDDLPIPSLASGPATLASRPEPTGPARPRSAAPVVTAISARRLTPSPDSPRPGFSASDALVDSADFVSSPSAQSAAISSGDIADSRVEPATDSTDFVDRPEPAVDSNDFVERPHPGAEITFATPVGGVPIAHTPRGGEPIARFDLGDDPSGGPRSAPSFRSAELERAASSRPRSSARYDDDERRSRDLPTLPPSRARRYPPPSEHVKGSSSWVGWVIAALMLAFAVGFFVRKRSADSEPAPEATPVEPVAPPVAETTEELPVPPPPPPSEPALTSEQMSAEPTSLPPAGEAKPTTPAPAPTRPPVPVAAPAPKPAPVTPKPAPAPKPAQEPAPAAEPKPAAKPKPKPAAPSDDRMLEGI